METSAQVLYEPDGSVAVVTLNRPEQRNALSPAVLRELTATLERARDDDSVRAVVLTGAGEHAFCAGADLGGFAADASEVDRHRERGLFVELFLTMARLGKPIVGAINGHALAGGLGLALSCDLLVAADSAQFGTPEIRVGVWPMMIMAIVTRTIGPKRSLQLFMTGERVDAQTALQWGMVNRVVPQAEVRSSAQAWASQLARWSPLVMRQGRNAFHTIDGLDLEAALRLLQSELTIVSLSEDFREGVMAFLQKRDPNFSGR